MLRNLFSLVLQCIYYYRKAVVISVKDISGTAEVLPDSSWVSTEERITFPDPVSSNSNFFLAKECPRRIGNRSRFN
jgi:hypothetical protein